MRRSNTSRRTNRALVPSRSAACSTDSSVSNSGVLPSPTRSSSSRCGRGGQLLPGHPSLFASAGGGRQRQPALTFGLIARADIDPRGDNDHGLVVLGPCPGIKRHAVAGPATLSELHAGLAQHGEGGGVAAALG